MTPLKGTVGILTYADATAAHPDDIAASYAKDHALPVGTRFEFVVMAEDHLRRTYTDGQPLYSVSRWHYVVTDSGVQCTEAPTIAHPDRSPKD